MAQGNQPETKFRIGNVTATVWLNDNKFYSVNLQKAYKDDAGMWQNTDSLGAGDLLNAAKALERAEDYIAQQ
jgi:hypothetical protein